jgi:hypothetical protein
MKGEVLLDIGFETTNIAYPGRAAGGFFSGGFVGILPHAIVMKSTTILMINLIVCTTN